MSEEGLATLDSSKWVVNSDETIIIATEIFRHGVQSYRRIRHFIASDIAAEIDNKIQLQTVQQVIAEQQYDKTQAQYHGKGSEEVVE